MRKIILLLPFIWLLWCAQAWSVEFSPDSLRLQSHASMTSISSMADDVLSEDTSSDQLALDLAQFSEADLDKIILPAAYYQLYMASQTAPDFLPLLYFHLHAFWLDKPPQSHLI